MCNFAVSNSVFDLSFIGVLHARHLCQSKEGIGLLTDVE